MPGYCLAADIILDVAVEVHRAVRTGMVRCQVLPGRLLPINGFADSWVPAFLLIGSRALSTLLECRDLQCSDFRGRFVHSQNGILKS